MPYSNKHDKGTLSYSTSSTYKIMMYKMILMGKELAGVVTYT